MGFAALTAKTIFLGLCCRVLGCVFFRVTRTVQEPILMKHGRLLNAAP